MVEVTKDKTDPTYVTAAFGAIGSGMIDFGAVTAGIKFTLKGEGKDWASVQIVNNLRRAGAVTDVSAATPFLLPKKNGNETRFGNLRAVREKAISSSASERTIRKK